MSPERRARERAAGTWRDVLIDSYLARVAGEHPDRLAVVDGDIRATYGEVEQAVDAVAAGLQALGVGPGEVVSWQLPNWYEAYVLHLATLRIGAVSNPLVPIYRHREVEYILAEAHSRVVVVPASFRGFDFPRMIEEIRDSLPELEHVVVVRPEPGFEGACFEGLAASGGAPEPVVRMADDPALLMFTSGTTSRPKGALHTHNTLDWENRSIIGMYELTDADVVFMPSPVSHITGLLYGLQLPAMLGTSVVLQDVWEPGEALDLIARNRCSFTIAATPFLHGLTYHPHLPEFDVSSLRIVGCGGADVPAGLIRDARARLGCVASRIYGSTEFPTLSTSGPGDPEEKGARTDGRRIPGAKYRVVDDSDRVLGEGETGEVVVTGPELFLGYLDDSDDERSFAPDRWFRTGDLASFDGDGYLTIRGRKKDIILRGGENISVTEVEELLFEHPAIEQVAIVAMPDPVMVERACAYVVLRPGSSLTLADVAAFLTGKRVARQKVPERLEIVHGLPKTLSGKVQKFRLRDQIRATLAAEHADVSQ